MRVAPFLANRLLCADWTNSAIRSAASASPMSASRLSCVECRRPHDDGPGWRAYLTVDGELALYCSA